MMFDSEKTPLQNVQSAFEKPESYYLEVLLNHFNSTKTNNALVRMYHEEISKDDFLKQVREHLEKIAKNRTEEFKNNVIHQFENYLWGFDVLEDLINDKSISDIKVVTYDNVRIKRHGKRMDGGVSFESEEAFQIFVKSIATRNGENLSLINAEKTFTDNKSHPKYTLRFTIATDFLTSTGQPYMHIRKLPKKHKSLSYYERKGLLITNEQIEYFEKRINCASGFLIIGKTGAGKTIFYNGLLDYVPRDKAILVIQDNEELNNARSEKDFLPHPEMLFLHTITASGDGKVEYDLMDLAQLGLRFDIDYVAIGEVTGGEAKYLLNCIKTGGVGMCTAHGSSVEDGMDKVADYITYETQYTKAEALAELRRLDTVVFVEDFEIKDVAEVTGYNREKGKLEFKHIKFSDKSSHREI